MATNRLTTGKVGSGSLQEGIKKRYTPPLKPVEKVVTTMSWGRVSIKFLSVVVCVFGVGGCSTHLGPKGNETKKISHRCSFEDVTEKAGIDFVHSWGAKHMRSIVDSVGSGAGFFDYNNDDLLDIYLLQGANGKSTLYRNNGDGTFSDVTEAAGVANNAIGLGVGAADYDNDGDHDLVVTNFGQSKLYENNGDGTFSDVTERAGIVGGGPFVAHVAFADIENDGDLDLLLVRYVEYDPNKKVYAGALSKREGFYFFAGPLDYKPTDQSLYRNNADGTFTDITVEAGLNKKAKGCAVAFSDFDGDGDQDFMIANDRFPKFLYENDGTGQFVERGVEAGIAYDEQGDATGGMAVGVDDYDGDGKPDAVITTMLFEHNPLYKNLGGLKFEDVAKQTGLSKDAHRNVAFGLSSVDIDNDGWRDIVITNGHVADYIDAYSQSISSKQYRQVYRNKGEGHFDLITPECGDLYVKTLGRGLAYGDFDNDGRVDLVTNDAGERSRLYRNITANSNHWLRVKTIGTKSNRDGIGTKIYVTAGGRTQYQEVRAESGYMATNDPRSLFGLGLAGHVDKVELRWPSGAVDVLKDVKVDQMIKVTEGMTTKGKAKK